MQLMSDRINNVASSAPLKNEQVLYSCPVYVGNGQYLELDLDTGSSDVWVFGSNCTAVDGSCNHPKINLNDTAITEWLPHKSLTIYYGSGNATVDIYEAPVSIGNDTAVFPIGVASSAYGMKSTNGLIGLAFNSLSTIAYNINKTARPPFLAHNTNFFDNLDFPQEQQMFSFYLSNYLDGDSGEVTFGGYDDSKFAGDIHWMDVMSTDITLLGYRQSDPPTPPTPFYWMFDLSDWTVSVNGTVPIFDQPLASGKYNTSIADTGTTLLILGYDIAKSINTAIGGTYSPTTGYYDLNCASADYPDVTFTHNGVDFSIPASIYLFRLSSVHCISGIIGQRDRKGLSIAIFGDIFLRAYYSIYDKSTDPPRVGFAKAAHPN
ncbi:Vacuolar protease A [Terramyces sp. JEL0728]|nr:Vacuolar protease A [Terramyces sp. JEL0728]